MTLDARMAELERLRNAQAIEALFWWGYAKRQGSEPRANARGDRAAQRAMELEAEMVNLAVMKQTQADP